jgi:ubiquinone/menaquinone biosynthesis C-methylase UbiE
MLNKQHAWVLGRSLDGSLDAQRQWLEKHFYDVPRIILSKFRECNIELYNKAVLDFGCGDSIIALGLLEIADLKQLIATDINVDSESISKKRIKHFLGKSLDSSEKLVRIQNTETHIPLESDSIDVTFSWSTFEHVSHPLESLQELKRVIKPGGFLFIQIFPMYYSAHGHHMWWDSNFPRYIHLSNIDLFESMLKKFSESNEYGEEFKKIILEEVGSLNRIRFKEIKKLLLYLNFNILKEDISYDPVRPNDISYGFSKKDLETGEIFIICQKMN